MQRLTEMKLGRIVDALMPHPVVQAALAEDQRQKTEARRAVAERLAAITAAAAKSLPKSRAALDVAKAELVRAEKALLGARAKVQRLQQEASNTSFAFTREHDALEQQLIAGADPAILVFIDEMRSIVERPPQVTMTESRIDVHPVTGRRQEVRETNFAAIQRYLEAVREAISQAEALRLLPDQTDIEARLAQLRTSLPRFDGTEAKP